MTATQMHRRNDQGENAATGTLCRQCRSPFAPKKSWQKFCSTACRRVHHAGGGMARLDDLENRVRDLEAAMWPAGK